MNKSQYGAGSNLEQEYVARVDLVPWEVIGAVLFVFAVSPVIVIANALLLAAMNRFKRLRTPSNYLIASLAASDLAVGIALPFGVYVRISETGPCLLVYCVFISFCCVSVIVMTTIALDRFTSLSQPLRYKDLITHASIRRCLFCFWMYSCLLGFTPAMLLGSLTKPTHLHCCSFSSLVDTQVQIFLLCCVYGPCCCLLVGCYAYTYAVARYHARAIYTVHISVAGGAVKHLAVSKYGQTLAVTVGCFLFLWLPFQACMVIDLINGSTLVDRWHGVLMAMPIFLGSATNPWIYGFRNAEIRAAVQKLVEEMLGKIGITPSRWDGPETSRNLDGAELNSFVSHMRLYADSPNRSHLRPTLLHHAPEKASLLVVPEIRLEVIVTASPSGEEPTAVVAKHSHRYFI